MDRKSKERADRIEATLSAIEAKLALLRQAMDVITNTVLEHDQVLAVAGHKQSLQLPVEE